MVENGTVWNGLQAYQTQHIHTQIAQTHTLCSTATLFLLLSLAYLNANSHTRILAWRVITCSIGANNCKVHPFASQHISNASQTHIYHLKTSQHTSKTSQRISNTSQHISNTSQHNMSSQHINNKSTTKHHNTPLHTTTTPHFSPHNTP